MIANEGSEYALRYAWSVDASGDGVCGPDDGARGRIYSPRPVPNAAAARGDDWACSQEVVLALAGPAAQS